MRFCFSSAIICFFAVSLTSTEQMSSSLTMASSELPSLQYLSGHDDSFSSYLALIRQSFTADIVNSVANLDPGGSVRKKGRDRELDVFGAEKYYGGGYDHSDLIFLKDDKQKLQGKSSHSSMSPSLSLSSVQSANSRSSLIRRYKQPSQATKKKEQGSGKSFLTVLRCYCSKEDTVEVEGAPRFTPTDLDNFNKSLSGRRSMTLPTSAINGQVNTTNRAWTCLR